MPSGLKATDGPSSVWPLRVRPSLATAHIPQLHGLIATARGQPRAIRAEGHRQTGLVWPLRVRTSSPLRDIPQLHGLIVTARGQPCAIRAEGHRRDPSWYGR